jgi:Glyoxalase-like domain
MTAPASLSIAALSINCADPVALADFWAQVLGRPVNPGATPEYAAIDAIDPAGGPKITLHKDPELKPVRNRLRLALRTDRFETESLRLVGLGAESLGDYEKPSLRWTTFADPEGNEFDLVTSQPA